MSNGLLLLGGFMFEARENTSIRFCIMFNQVIKTQELTTNAKGHASTLGDQRFSITLLFGFSQTTGHFVYPAYCVLIGVKSTMCVMG